MNFFLRVNFKCSIKEPRGFPSAGPTTTSCEAALSLWPAQELLLVLPRELGGLQEPQSCQCGQSTAASSRKSHYFRCRVKSALYKKPKHGFFSAHASGIGLASIAAAAYLNTAKTREDQGWSFPSLPCTQGKLFWLWECMIPTLSMFQGPLH